MKTLILFLIMGLELSTTMVNILKDNSFDHFIELPQKIELDKSVIRTYEMITDYYEYDLKSNFLRKYRLTGDITYHGDSIQWNNVYFTQSNDLNAEYPQGEKWSFLQDFKYKEEEQILTAEFFQTHLPKGNPLVMNLIWDALGFNVLAYDNWYSLKLNEEFQATNIQGEMEIADIGTFENKDTKITWVGITKINNKRCAILKYSVINNPLNLKYETLSMKGRSHYWGEIYVSLSDKHIEYATLMEDVLTETKISGISEPMIGYTVRTIYLSKRP